MGVGHEVSGLGTDLGTADCPAAGHRLIACAQVLPRMYSVIHTFVLRKAPQEAERLLVAARVESGAKDAIARDEGAGVLRKEVLDRM